MKHLTITSRQKKALKLIAAASPVGYDIILLDGRTRNSLLSRGYIAPAKKQHHYRVTPLGNRILDLSLFLGEPK